MSKIEVEKPWNLNSSQVEIIDGFSSMIVGSSDDGYFIEFTDSDGSVVEASLPESEFVELPYPVKMGSYFGIIIFRFKGMTRREISVWPVSRYWNQSLCEKK